MTVPFNSIPSALRVPLFYAEVDRSAANQGGADTLRSLLVGGMTASGTATSGALTRVSSVAQAITLFGRGSMLHRMAIAYFAGDALGEVWAIPLADIVGGGAAAATGTITTTAIPSADGTLPLYIGGSHVPVPLAAADTKVQVAAKIHAAIGADLDLPVTSATDGIDKVTLTARNKGTLGNAIDVRTNWAGTEGGEVLPAGLALTIVAMGAGASDPLATTAIDAMLDEPFEIIVWPYSNDYQDLVAEMADTAAGRWGALRQLYGHVVSAKDDTVGNLGTFGNGRNYPHVSIFGNYRCPTWGPEVAAAAAAAMIGSVRIDPARPTHTLATPHVKAPAKADRFLTTEANALLFDGIATFAVNARTGAVSIMRAITNYQTNDAGAPDASCLDSETLFTLAAIMRRLKSAITSKYGRHKLVNDGTRTAPGQAAVSPSGLRAELIAEYGTMEADGLVENAEAFAAALIVERNALDPNRVDVLFPPDLVNQLRVFAVLNQFRLQYPTAAA